MQRSRRTNPYPYTWELPVTGILALLLFLLLGLQAGRSVANLIAGHGWAFVAREVLFSSLGGLLDGDAAAGLDGIADPASAGLMWACIAVLEVLVLAACAWVGKWALDRWGPGRLQGMATTAQAEALLGRTRLRKHAQVIRPDLYGGGKKEAAR